MSRSGFILLLLLTFTFASLLPAAPPPGHQWMLLLSDAPVVERYPGRIERTRAVSENYRQQLRTIQNNLRPQIEALPNVKVTGAIQHLLNAIFVNAAPAQATAMRNLPGVIAV